MKKGKTTTTEKCQCLGCINGERCTREIRIDKTPETTEKCLCACHENKLNKPYEHDSKCCDLMNGYVETTEKWTEEFDNKFDNVYYGKDNDGIPNYPPEGFKDDVKLFIRQTRQEAKQEALDIIAEGSGWEESYDIYAKKLNLPTRYSK